MLRSTNTSKMASDTCKKRGYTLAEIQSRNEKTAAAFLPERITLLSLPTSFASSETNYAGKGFYFVFKIWGGNEQKTKLEGSKILFTEIMGTRGC